MSSSLEDLVSAFRARVDLINEQAALQCAPPNIDEQWREIDDNVTKMHEQVLKIKLRLTEDARGADELKELRTLLEAEKAQLEAIEKALPVKEVPAPSAAEPVSRSDASGEQAQILQEQQAGAQQRIATSHRPQKRADPCRDVTEAEFEQVPATTRGRVTVAQVNSGLKALIAIAEKNWRFAFNNDVTRDEKKQKALQSVLGGKKTPQRLLVLQKELPAGSGAQAAFQVLKNLERVVSVKNTPLFMWEIK